MPREVLINAGAGEVRVAVIEDGVLDQLWLERTIGFEEVPGRKRDRAANGASRSIVGDIVLGRVQRVLPVSRVTLQRCRRLPSSARHRPRDGERRQLPPSRSAQVLLRCRSTAALP